MIRAVNEGERPEKSVFGDSTALVSARQPARAGNKDDKEDKDRRGTGTDVITKPRTRTKKPRLYKVLLLNDDYTPMDFVIYVLEQYFNKSRSEATGIMLQVHRSGVGVCGVFTYEVAETKVAQVMNFARQNEHPLQCTMEKE
jgi:ATP-dependent Clp protease adaptor protein ClpS